MTRSGGSRGAQLRRSEKTLMAAEQMRPNVARFRARWKAQQHRLDHGRLIFIEGEPVSATGPREQANGIRTHMTQASGWTPKGKQLVAQVPHGHWKTLIFFVGLRDRIVAPFVLDGPISGEMFTARIAQGLTPTLAPRRGGHRRQARQPQRPNRLPEPIRNVGARRNDASWRRVGTFVVRVTPQDRGKTPVVMQDRFNPSRTGWGVSGWGGFQTERPCGRVFLVSSSGFASSSGVGALRPPGRAVRHALPPRIFGQCEIGGRVPSRPGLWRDSLYPWGEDVGEIKEQVLAPAVGDDLDAKWMGGGTACRKSKAGKAHEGRGDLWQLRLDHLGEGFGGGRVVVVGEGEVARDRHQDHRPVSEEAAPQPREAGAGLQRAQDAFQSGRRGDAGQLAVDEAGVRVGFAGQGIGAAKAELGQPEGQLQFHRFAQRGEGGFLDHPAIGLKLAGGAGQGLADFGGGLQPVGGKGKGRAFGVGCGRRRGCPPGVARVGVREGLHRKAQVGGGTGEGTRDSHELPADQPVARCGVEGGHAAQAGAQPVDAAGMGGIADGACDVGAMADGAKARGDGCGGPTRGTAGGEAGERGVSGRPMQGIAGEPAQAEGRGIGAADDDGPRTAQVGDRGAVFRSDQAFLDAQPVGGGKALLVDVDLDWTCTGSVPVTCSC